MTTHVPLPEALKPEEAVQRIGIAALEPDEETMASLTVLLRQAESGELRGFAYVGYLIDSNITYGYVGPEMGTHLLQTHGLLCWLAQRAMTRWESRNDVIRK